MKSRRIYLASSWRNSFQPQVLAALRAAGHEVYDFRNPAPGNSGFAWSEVDREWLKWSPSVFAQKLNSSAVAAAGFAHDKAALDWCDTCVLALPCGRSAHLELGYAAGQGKDTYVLLHEDKFEPELMYLLNTAVATDIQQIIDGMAQFNPSDAARWHQENGGAFIRPAAHATRFLREAVEFCVAAGATSVEISGAVEAEIDKAASRGEFGGNSDGIAEEYADCRILLDLYAEYAGFDALLARRAKMGVLWDRKWQADEAGVLWRPGAQDETEFTPARGGAWTGTRSPASREG